jgi:hypothetical protein
VRRAPRAPPVPTAAQRGGLPPTPNCGPARPGPAIAHPEPNRCVAAAGIPPFPPHLFRQEPPPPEALFPPTPRPHSTHTRAHQPASRVKSRVNRPARQLSSAASHCRRRAARAGPAMVRRPPCRRVPQAGGGCGRSDGAPVQCTALNLPCAAAAHPAARARRIGENRRRFHPDLAADALQLVQGLGGAARRGRGCGRACGREVLAAARVVAASVPDAAAEDAGGGGGEDDGGPAGGADWTAVRSMLQRKRARSCVDTSTLASIQPPQSPGCSVRCTCAMLASCSASVRVSLSRSREDPAAKPRRTPAKQLAGPPRARRRRGDATARISVKLPCGQDAVGNWQSSEPWGFGEGRCALDAPGCLCHCLARNGNRKPIGDG